MKLYELEYFCNCILKTGKDHVTAVDTEEVCVYCGHYAVHRKVTEKDIRDHKKYGGEINNLKQQHLDVLLKTKKHKEPIQ